MGNSSSLGSKTITSSTDAAWQALREALASKFEGTQSIALRVLGHWGGQESVQVLREFLHVSYERRSGDAIRGVCVEELARTVSAGDVAWVLDLYFSRQQPIDTHALLPLVVALPLGSARQRLVAELRSVESVRRQAAVNAIGNMRFADRSALLRPLIDDPVPLVSKSAQLLARET